MTEGPIPDLKFTAPKGYWEKLKAICSKHPKGRPYDDKGQFYPDPTPVAPPIGYTPEQSMFDRMRELVRREISQGAAQEGFETMEEADDFVIDDDVEPFSPYEVIVEQALPDGPVVNPEAPPGSPSSGSPAASAPVVPAGPGPATSPPNA